MNDLVFIRSDDVFTNTLIIAEGTENEHNSVTRIIRNYPADFLELGKNCFMDLKSKNKLGDLRGRPQKAYLLNEPQATLLITYLDNNEKVRRFKIELVKQFYSMRSLLTEKRTSAWQETRQIGKDVRKRESDYIKELVEYAKGQGSKNAHMLFTAYSKLANNTVGIENRDQATTLQINNLLLVEKTIDRCIADGIKAGTYYKDIYRACKTKLDAFRDVLQYAKGQA